MDDFSTLDLPPALRQAIDALGFTQPTPVQAASLPHVLAGRDVIAQAPTGSGKTLAFGLGLLARVDPALIRAQALVLCPTRELADQVGKQIRRLAFGIPNLKLSILCGGVSLRPQLASLEAHDPHVVVGTPGRIQELTRKGVLHLGGVKTLVLDEADRMLDMGFEEAIREIAKKTAGDRQTLLFSATFPDAIRAIARGVMRNPEEVTVAGEIEQAPVEETFVEAELARKPAVLAALLLEAKPESCVVFCNTRRDVDDVAATLVGLGFDALPLHGDMEQRDRDEVLVRFANRSCNVLVASDVAARGLDVQDLAAVVNYELPTDADVYVHRIGRTGRAGKGGAAYSLVTPREMPRALAMESQRGALLRWRRVQPLSASPKQPPQSGMISLRIDAGRSDKLRPGDIVGALTGAAGMPVEVIGKIDVFPTRSYVAIRRKSADQALAKLREGGIKGRKFRVRRM
ncbi:ATP-dependent RNA helicase DbpA [Chiayiivirga flava]|uniref:ATP-independent RNA helicase DbpA n=1 Tax=Chiayiivirga flava TaxID=659595 RepID=A0A7W8G0I4_9GAMM|nr:ATP-dependent RNA helicase DbpA [Chiayiivirga flava]MBB5209527.1 ATP-independent RNA helicase DbpA [Chiayiivirga flava]